MSETINREEIIKRLTLRVGTDKETASDSLDALERIIIDSMATNKRVAIKGFGSFYLRVRFVKPNGLPQLQGSPLRRESIICFRASSSLVAVNA